MSSPQSPIDRLKVLLNSSTPIVVMETVEEMRAVSLVRIACSELILAVFEWSIADGLVRSGSGVAAPQPVAQTWVPQRPDYRAGALPQGNSEADRLVRAVMSSSGSDSGAAPKSAMYNTADPVQALANLETLTVEAAFVLKDFHRHMDNPVVVRRLRDVGQKFSANRRTLVLTAPSIEMPPELAGLVEIFDIPLPDINPLREIIRETYTPMAGPPTLKRQVDPKRPHALANNLPLRTAETPQRAVAPTL